MELKDLYNIHKGEDVYVLGSGPSLGYINSDFWENRIIVCINATIELPIIRRHKPKDLYLVAKEPSKKMQDAAKRKKAKVVTCPTHSGVAKAPKNKIYHPEITIMFQPRASCIQNKNQTNKLERSSSTIITGMHLAVFMGCKTIFLIGHDCGSINGKRHVDGYNKEGAVNPEGRYHAWMISKKVEQKTLDFKRIVKKHYGVNVYSINPFINFGLEGNKYNHWEKKEK